MSTSNKLFNVDSDKSIVFDTESVKSILDERKTVTRRVLAEKCVLDKKYGLDSEPYVSNKKWYYNNQITVDDYTVEELDSGYQVGDILYVKETWCDRWLPDGFLTGADRYGYKADGIPKYGYWGNDKQNKMGVWSQSTNMPKEAARIWLKVTNIKVERLQDITEEQAKLEGVSEEQAMAWWHPTFYDPDSGGYPEYRKTFAYEIWDRNIKKSELNKYGWNANPWVYVIEFERIR